MNTGGETFDGRVVSSDLLITAVNAQTRFSSARARPSGGTRGKCTCPSVTSQEEGLFKRERYSTSLPLGLTDSPRGFAINYNEAVADLTARSVSSLSLSRRTVKQCIALLYRHGNVTTKQCGTLRGGMLQRLLCGTRTMADRDSEFPWKVSVGSIRSPIDFMGHVTSSR